MHHRLLLLLLIDAAGAALLGTRWTVNLDVGQERGSWMPPRWGASGVRAVASPILQFADNGRLELVGSGAWDHLTVKFSIDEDGCIGGWQYAADEKRVRFWLNHDGLERGDVRLKAGRLWCTAGAWGSLLARRGSLTIKQRKLGWLPFLPSATVVPCS